MWTLSEENEAKIPEWNKRWLEDVILRTKPMTPQEKLEVEKAIREMYRLVGLDDTINIVFVRSPLAVKVVAKAAEAFWRKKDTTFDVKPFDLIYDAVHSEMQSTSNAHSDRIFNATIDYTSNSLFRTVSRAAATAIMNSVQERRPGHWTQGFEDSGNLESYRCAYVSFVRDIIGFKCEEHKNYKNYETCARLSSQRHMYSKFCIISDFPTELYSYTRNGRMVAHNDKGPSHLWADGFAIWTINGIAVTEQIVMSPETLTIKQIDTERNEEIKRIMIDRFGWARYLTETNAKCLDARINDVDGTSEALLVLKDKSVRLLCACKSTARVYAIRVDNKTKTCQEAQSWMSGDKKINVIGVS